MMLLALLAAAALTADAVVVETTAALRAAVDRQEATIILGADLSLGGEPLIITADCDVRGHGHALFQGPGARHMHVNGTVALLSRRGSSKRRLTSESPATIKARACDERGRLTSHSTSGTNSGTGDSRVSRKLVNFRTLTWQSSQGGESKDGSDNPPSF
mmetsp:Transcript_13875/g.37979  ORF Transcript_13875/g.37979 Transcript_13875/m.37979 type:complete len:159 (+) Transcript_13875:235-711(+)